MILNLLNKIYWCIGLALLLLIGLIEINTKENLYIFITVAFIFITFGIIITISREQKTSFYTSKNLAFINLTYSVLIILLLKFLSNIIDDDLFVFSKMDALLYHTSAIKISNMGFIDGISYILKDWGVDDLGAFLFISTIYRIYPSLILLALSYCLIGTLSSLMIFSIGKNLMPRRYAFLCSLTFSISSFVLLFQAQCLKETIMLCIIILSFYLYYQYLKSRKILTLAGAFLIGATVLLFRTPVALILILSLGISAATIYLKGIYIIIFGTIFTLIIFSTSLFSYTYQRYLRSGNVELIIERKNSLAYGGGLINQITDPIAAFVGPFPGVISRTEINKSSLTAPGLFYRVLLAPFFIFGLIYAIKNKANKIYPLLLFFTINALGVAISVKVLEMRITLPH